MGAVVDYFKPVGAYSFCDMLQSNDKHQWSPDAQTWVTPAYYVGALYGGSAANWPRDNVPGDQRKYLPKWQNVHDPQYGACCHYTYSDAANWNRDFTMAYCLAAATPASATGDPHLQNVHGERFDLMKEGKHVLISIPRGESAELTLLRVQADARRLGGQCTDMYFQELNVTGSWAEAKHTDGYHYDVSQSAVETPQWVEFGKVELKVVHGRTDSGLRYLNLYAKHLGRAGFAVGGLLGDDDHEDVSTPGAECMHHVSLQKIREHMYSRVSSAASIAEGTIA
jgi:hypothetical protein